MKMSWTWFHKLGSPKWFYAISGRMLPWLTVCAIVLLLVGVTWGLAFAPQDYQQGNSFRIIYIHVPAAMLAQSCYVLLAVAGVVGLVWKMKLADVALQCAAPIGAWMTAVALVTGAIWGKPTWGSWWVWDARLTSMLILLFLYFVIGVPIPTAPWRLSALKRNFCSRTRVADRAMSSSVRPPFERMMFSSWP